MDIKNSSKMGVAVALVGVSVSIPTLSVVHADGGVTTDDIKSTYGVMSIVKDSNILEVSKFENKEDKLFELAKNNKGLIGVDENGNEVYKIVQVKNGVTLRSGEITEEYQETTFSKIEDHSSKNTRASLTEDGWDRTSSAFIKSTINYTREGNKLKLISCSGSVSKLNSGVKVQNLKVTIGATNPWEISTKKQVATKDYGTSTSFSYTAPSTWKPVENIISGNSRSVIGCSIAIKLGRSSTSTWTQRFINNVGYHYNGA